MHGWQSPTLRHGSPQTLVVVHDLNILGVAIHPNEADAVSIVDPDAVLSSPVAGQRFEPVSGKCRQVSKCARCVDLLQLPLGHPRDLLQTSAEVAGKQRLGLGVLERPDHVTFKL